jgi:hypothetical protein
MLSAAARGLKEGRTEVRVKMLDPKAGLSWVWSRDKFINRKFIMQEMYNNYVMGGKWDLSQDKDPFWEPVETDMHVGSVHVYLQSLGYLIDMDETLQITDYQGNSQGNIKVKIVPCNTNGKPFEEGAEDGYVEDPDELIGKQMQFKIMIEYARGIPTRFTKGVHCKFRFYLDTQEYVTKAINGTPNPDFNFEKLIKCGTVTEQFLRYLRDQPLVIEVWAQQDADKSKAAAAAAPATAGAPRALSAAGDRAAGAGSPANAGETNALRQRVDMLERKLDRIGELVRAAEDKKAPVDLKTLKDLVNYGGSLRSTIARVPADGSGAPATNTSQACTLQ